MKVTPPRRFGAMLYDALLLIALLMIATLPFLPFAQGKVLVPREVGALAYLYWIWQIVIVVCYFGLLWRAQGRTLGMQAWRLCIERTDGAPITWRDSVTRILWAAVPWLPAFATMSFGERPNAPAFIMPFGVALLGLGLLNYFAAYWRKDGSAWHERRLRTRIVRE